MKKRLVILMVFLLVILLVSCSKTTGNQGNTETTNGTDTTDSAAETSEGNQADPTASSDVIELEGTMDGDINIHMTIRINDGQVAGSYYYDDYQTKIPLSGNVEANGMITMNEYGDDGTVTGTFDGWYVPGIRISGNWTNQKTNDVTPFELKILNGISDNAVWSGEWKRVNGGLFNSADLVMFNESSESFDFQINAFYGGHTGFIGGTADIEGGTAHYLDEETGAELSFILEDTIIQLEANDAANALAGAGVVFEGAYTKDELSDDITLLSVGYVSSEEQENQFQKMTGQDSELFLYTAQIRTETDDLDGYGAEVYTWWVIGLAGCNESIVMFLPDGHLCAGVIDCANNEIKVYTDASYIQDVPETIEVWSEGVPDFPMEFINTSK